MGDLALTMTSRDGSDKTAEVIARNDAIFRDANERIEAFAEAVEAKEHGPLPFLCECADLTCTEIITLTGSEYEALRRDPRRFATVPGHEGDEDWARVAEENDRYATIEKLGHAADVAAGLDPRSSGTHERT